ncbi:MAG: hypothetical protein IJ200_08285 [Prevotella sp.]|nr:hypothetical protein [Prevotella sp.]
MTMRKLLHIFLFTALLTACDYDEEVDLCSVTVRLVYPENSIEPYDGARVELKDASASVYVSATDGQGTARFLVPAGIYEASSNNTFIDDTGDTWWRYNFNGVKSQILISRDSENTIDVELLMSRRRIVH